MPSLDLQYVTELVRHAKQGDSNAYAELFAATYEKQYQFCCSYLQDPFLAQEALQETYIQALQNLSRVNDNGLVISWLTQISFRVCLKLKQKHDPSLPSDPERITVSIAGKPYTLHQLLNLPFTEGQVLLLRWFCGLKSRKIASLMELKASEVKDYMKSGIRRLPQFAAGGDV
ncbi:MAG: hypothetical protein IJO67_00795 [Clostridia bacterium]|nr:hypothetical protein [Clostridia bacterium]